MKGGDGHNTQVFTVRVLDGESTSHMLPQKGTRLVAKVYDPLYFNDDEGYLNPFLCMDKYYTHEANAYMVLRDFQGQWIPNYYGSYSLVLSVDSVRTRTVRMILVEYIPGITMADCEPGNFCQSARLLIRKSIVDLESRIYKRTFCSPTSSRETLSYVRQTATGLALCLSISHMLFSTAGEMILFRSN